MGRSGAPVQLSVARGSRSPWMGSVSTPASEESKSRFLIAAANAAACAAPFFLVTIPPSTDLPQHLAQARLFLDVLGGDTIHRIQWTSPYSGVYALLVPLVAVLPPFFAGTVAMALLAAANTLATHALAWKFARPPAAAVLASILFFGNSTTWGFLNFLVGWPLFAVWVILLARQGDSPTPRRAAALAAWAVLMFWSHALWFAGAILWMAVECLAERRTRSVLLARAAAVAPAMVLALWWYLGFRESWVATGADWRTGPLDRLNPAWLANATVGALRGAFPQVFFWAMIAWAFAAVSGRVTDPERTEGAAHRTLLLGGAAFALLVFALPHSYQNAVFFEQRWAPVAATLLLLGLPALRLPGRAALAAVGIAAALHLGWLTLAWQRFERANYAGFADCLAALPDKPRLLGLEYRTPREPIYGMPLLEAFAWGQVLRGGRLSFSFAEFPHSFVVLADRTPKPWTGGLEWNARAVTDNDFAHFDFVLVSAPEATHRELAAKPFLEQVAGGSEGWRLYRVVWEVT